MSPRTAASSHVTVQGAGANVQVGQALDECLADEIRVAQVTFAPSETIDRDGARFGGRPSFACRLT